MLCAIFILFRGISYLLIELVISYILYLVERLLDISSEVVDEFLHRTIYREGIVSVQEVNASLSKMKNRIVAEVDGIHIKILKHNRVKVKEWIVHFYSNIVNSEVKNSYF